MARTPKARPTRRRLVFLCGVGAVLVTAVLALFPPALLARIENDAYDILSRAIDTRPISGRVVIVDIDERSLATIGQWPWRRDRIGELIDRLRDLGAATVALDMVFAEADRFGDPGTAESTPRSNAASAFDEALAATLRDGRVVLGHAMRFDAVPLDANRCVLHPVAPALIGADEESGDAHYFHATGVVCNLPTLAEAAGASGFMNAAPDADGILRRVPVLMELDGRVYPSLALAATMAVTSSRDLVLRVANVNTATLSIGDRVVPVDGRGNALLRYRGPKQTFPYVSAADVMSGRVPAATLQDKIVFVGTTALGTREVVATPLDTLFVGVEVQATVADNLLQQDFIRRSQFGTVLEALAVVILGIFVAWVVAGTRTLAGVLVSIASIAAVWYFAGWMLSTTGLFVSPLFPTIGVTAVLGTMTLAKFAVERLRADTAGRERTNAQRLMIQTLLSLTETRDAETGRHSRRTQQYVRVLAEQLSANPEYRAYLTPERIDLVSSLAPLHDIGKVGVPDHILNKPGALTPDELKEMQRHPEYGYEVILKAEGRVGVRDDAILAVAKDIVYTHHEKWDGTGYPRKLRGKEIPIEGRVMAVVDVYDATTTRTLYRPPMSHEDAVKFIVDRKATHFDPAVVQAFVDVATQFKRVGAEYQD
ncbi:MAG TPA: CHASE2 domain-containing protein [Vicinamibacterales bacterium]